MHFDLLSANRPSGKRAAEAPGHALRFEMPVAQFFVAGGTITPIRSWLLYADRKGSYVPVADNFFSACQDRVEAGLMAPRKKRCCARLRITRSAPTGRRAASQSNATVPE